MKKAVTGAVLIVAVLIGGFLYQKYRIAPRIKFDTLELTDLNGKPVKLQDYQGKKIFLNFFATWCGPCVGEFPSLNRASEILQPDSFVFISISDEPLNVLNHFNARFNPQYILVLHSVKDLHELGIFTIPTNYLLNNKNEVVFQKTGDENWAAPEVITELKQKANGRRPK